MAENCDVLIAGLGAMGSAAAFHCARRGLKVIGLERFLSPHALGSSHGQTRIIREAYFEDPAYVPIVQQAYRLWAELEQLSGETLFQKTGGLMIGPESGSIFPGALRSAHEHQLAHEVLTADELRKRHPALNPPAGSLAVWEPRAGILFPEKCVGAHLQLAMQHGASLKSEEPLIEWTPVSGGVLVRSAKGEYRSRKLILRDGAWPPELLGNFPVPLRVERQILFWFENRNPPHFKPGSLPVFLLEYALDQFCYGFPDLGNGVKVAQHHQGEPVSPASVRREVNLEEVRFMEQKIAPYMPELTRVSNSAVCMYTNTPSCHFLMDFHPASDAVLIASPCSGHGFKFSSALGEVMANLVGDGESRFDLSLFRIASHIG